MPHFNWLQFIVSHHYLHVACVALVLVLILVLAYLASKKLEKQKSSYAPQGEFNVLSIFEALVRFYSFKSGGHYWKRCPKIHSFFFVFVFVYCV